MVIAQSVPFLHPLIFLIRSLVSPLEGATENLWENAPTVGKSLFVPGKKAQNVILQQFAGNHKVTPVNSACINKLSLIYSLHRMKLVVFVAYSLTLP